MMEESTMQYGNYGNIEITAVIPAYNEAENIGHVLAVLQEVADVTQIIVVDDGSEDETAVVVRQFQTKDRRVQFLSQVANQGKGSAMFAGAAASQSSVLLFLDADLKELQAQHVYDLIRPVQEGSCAMSVGLFADGRWTTNITHHFFPFLSGQRCLYWPLFADLYRKNIKGWSIETALNLHTWLKKYPVEYVMWPGVTHAPRPEKRQGLAGYWSHVLMWWEIAHYVFHFMAQQAWPNWSENHEAEPVPPSYIIK
jgi:glycosyltransferase involved in cell wall biosynthesis